MEFNNTTVSDFRNTTQRIVSLETDIYLPAAIFVFILCIVGVVGNGHILFVFLCRTRPSTQRVFVITLGCLDMTSCLLSMPFVITVNLHPYSFNNEIACKLLSTTGYVTGTSSGLVLVMIAIDRYRRVCKPFGRQMTKTSAKYFCLLAICIGLVFTWPPMLLYEIREKESVNITATDCTLGDDVRNSMLAHLFNFSLLFLAGISVLILIILYALIWRAIVKHNDFRSSFKAAGIDRQVTIEYSIGELTETIKEVEETSGDESGDELEREENDISVELDNVRFAKPEDPSNELMQSDAELVDETKATNKPETICITVGNDKDSDECDNGEIVTRNQVNKSGTISTSDDKEPDLDTLEDGQVSESGTIGDETSEEFERENSDVSVELVNVRLVTPEDPSNELKQSDAELVDETKATKTSETIGTTVLNGQDRDECNDGEIYQVSKADNISTNDGKEPDLATLESGQVADSADTSDVPTKEDHGNSHSSSISASIEPPVLTSDQNDIPVLNSSSTNSNDKRTSMKQLVLIRRPKYHSKIIRQSRPQSKVGGSVSSVKSKKSSGSAIEKLKNVKIMLRRRKTVIMFGWITALFVISYVLHQCLLLAVFLNPEVYTNLSENAIGVYNTLLWLVFVNAVCNWVIYGYFDSRFRKEVKKLYTNCCCKRDASG